MGVLPKLQLRHIMTVLITEAVDTKLILSVPLITNHCCPFGCLSRSKWRESDRKVSSLPIAVDE